MKIRTTIPASEIIKIQSSIYPIKKIIGFFLKTLRAYFGSEIYLELPENLQDASLSEIKAAVLAQKLKSLGIITSLNRISQRPDEPFIYFYSTTSPKLFYDKKIVGVGADFFNRENAIWKSLGEIMERDSWLHLKEFNKKIIVTSYKNLKRKALNIFKLAGFSKDKDPDILFFDENTLFGWKKIISLNSGKEIYCPAQLLSSDYFRKKVRTRWRNPNNEEPLLRWPVSTGTAAGRSQEEAIVAGIMENIERDAFMISYLNKLSPDIIDLDHIAKKDSDLARVIKQFKRSRLELYVLQLPTDFPVFVTLAICIDRTGRGPALTVGADGDFNLKSSILDSLTEALSGRIGLIYKENYKKEINSKFIDHEGRTIYWSKPERLPKIEFFLRGKSIKPDIAEDIRDSLSEKELKSYYQKKLNFLKKKISNFGYEAGVFNLTPAKIKKLGFHCVSVIIPELQPLHLIEAHPYFYGKRLKEVPKKFGFSVSPEINTEPHPFP